MPTALPHTCTAKVRLKLTIAVSVYLVLCIVLLQCTSFPFLLITTYKQKSVHTDKTVSWVMICRDMENIYTVSRSEK